MLRSLLSQHLAMMRAGDAGKKNGRCVGYAYNDWTITILPRSKLHAYRGQAENPCADSLRQLLVVRCKRNLDQNCPGSANFSVRPSTTPLPLNWLHRTHHLFSLSNRILTINTFNEALPRLAFIQTGLQRRIAQM